MGAPPGAPAPLVSVLMPTFRQAPFLPRALRSLLDQQLPDWELLVVDDASPDGTPAALAPFLRDPRIRALRLERNVGTGAALNLATSLARGRYIAYLPSDDVFFPDHLQRLVDHLEGHPDVYLAYGGTSCSDCGCATPSSGTPPGPSLSGTSRRSPFRAIGRSASAPPALT